MMSAWKGQRAFAQAAIIASRPASMRFCNRDFALAGEQLDGAHLAQIHPHRIVGALAGLRLLDLGDGLLGDLDELVVGIVVAVVLLVLAFAIVRPR